MSKTVLIDTHCHIDFADFDQDRQAVLDSALQKAVQHIIVPAISQQSWYQTISCCQQFSQLHLALGLHPVFIDQHQKQHINELEQLVDQYQPIAIGEIGLDFYLKDLDRDKQLDYFEQQLIIAKQHQLPVIIHNRKAHDQCIQLLKQHSPTGGIIHAFNGSQQQADKYIELGFLLGFGGMLTYRRSRKLHQLVRQLPLQHIVLETDAPDMTVEQYRGQRNSPEYLPLILNKIADLTNKTEMEIANTTCENVLRVFPTMTLADK